MGKFIKNLIFVNILICELIQCSAHVSYDNDYNNNDTDDDSHDDDDDDDNRQQKQQEQQRYW